MFKKILITISFLALMVPVHVLSQTAASETMSVKLLQSPDARHGYERALLTAILERTAEHYPAYDLEVVASTMSSRRNRVEVARGERVNVYVSGLRDDHLVESGGLLLIDEPTMAGLLGYRAMVTRPEFVPRLRQAVAEDRLRELVVGQGVNWNDAETLRHNGFQVSQSGEYQNILTMLAHRRFDTVFLGVIEAWLEVERQGLGEALAVESAPLIYYPHPMVFAVSGEYPELAERIARGFEAVIADGTRAALMREHFAQPLAAIREAGDHIIRLEHPEPDQIRGLEEPNILSVLAGE